jgi:hypothetical protein
MKVHVLFACCLDLDESSQETTLPFSLPDNRIRLADGVDGFSGSAF